MGDNLIVKLSFDFALLIVVLAEELELKRKFVVANQVLKSGTSIGANIWEAQNAESRPDFIHKMKISAKECEETKYWLLLCKYSENYPESDHLIEKVTILQKISTKLYHQQKSSAISKLANYHIVKLIC